MGQKSSVPVVEKKKLTIIDVTHLDKTELLKQLLLALPQRWEDIHWMENAGGRNEQKNFIHWDQPLATEEPEPALKYEDIDHDSAEAAVSIGFIEKFGDRNINVNLLGNFVDATQYDEIAGKGTFARVVSNLRVKTNV